MRNVIVVLALATVSLVAQDVKIASEKAPARVNEALLARVKQFYQAHVEGKFRQADEVVAEESKDLFFSMAKPRYLGYEVVRVNYLNPQFTAAEAVVSCQMNWTFHGQTSKMNMPANSQWKLLNGKWFIFFPPPNEKATPFGTMHPGPDNVSMQGGSVMPGTPDTLARQILNSVSVDKNELLLKGYEDSVAEVKVTNGMQGSIRLNVDLGGGFAGLSYKLDNPEVLAGKSATIQFVCKPKDGSVKPILNATIRVEPTGQVFPVKLVFDVQPELRKLIPKESQPQR